MKRPLLIAPILWSIAATIPTFFTAAILAQYISIWYADRYEGAHGEFGWAGVTGPLVMSVILVFGTILSWKRYKTELMEFRDFARAELEAGRNATDPEAWPPRPKVHVIGKRKDA